MSTSISTVCLPVISMLLPSGLLSVSFTFVFGGAALAMSSEATVGSAVLPSATAAATWTLGSGSLSAALRRFRSACLAVLRRSAMARMQCSLMLASVESELSVVFDSELSWLASCA